ncbi:putative Histone-lysine N-methyltransferase SUV420H14-20 [Senna tora]|uniref:Putative Histone-lysine N-methyltransferase SUV420H14-20 n=1 Tax=Senna tora TaxID=362788 RepID=A0A834U127_9FABA|nr:putative Histone-lysine N-methyltransferase SUV420H14-20 [Senna tora]
MRGIGGPLLCIGDLLNDVGDDGDIVSAHSPSLSSSSSSVSDPKLTPPSSDLTKLFQVLFTYLISLENYEHLNKALAGTDHSWTALTLKLCTALETANQLVQSTNSNVALLSEKVGELQKIVKRGDSAIAAAKAVHVTPDDDKGASA